MASKAQRDLEHSLAFGLAVDESTDIQHSSQIVRFVRYISSVISVKEEMLDLREISCGVDIKYTLDRVLTNIDISLN